MDSSKSAVNTPSVFTLLFHCTGEKLILDLNDYNLLNYGDFIDNIIANHVNESETRFHLPKVTINERVVENAGRYITMEIVKPGDVINVTCGTSQIMQSASMNGPNLLAELLRYATDRVEIPFRQLVLTREQADNLRAQMAPPQVGEDVKVVLPEEEFEGLGIFLNSVQEDDCAICQDNMKEGENLKKLLCSHTFHVDCIHKWLTKESIKCPVCKEETSTKKTFINMTQNTGARQSAQPVMEIPAQRNQLRETYSIPVPNIYAIDSNPSFDNMVSEDDMATDGHAFEMSLDHTLPSLNRSLSTFMRLYRRQ